MTPKCVPNKSTTATLQPLCPPISLSRHLAVFLQKEFNLVKWILMQIISGYSFLISQAQSLSKHVLKRQNSTSIKQASNCVWLHMDASPDSSAIIRWILSDYEDYPLNQLPNWLIYFSYRWLTPQDNIF